MQLELLTCASNSPVARPWFADATYHNRGPSPLGSQRTADDLLREAKSDAAQRARLPRSRLSFAPNGKRANRPAGN
ncbi:hypothetical protein SCP_1101850 [Sparassis crispa]|uniref:Uncharacterized protein n=1 Tax=Sparassis crispa TaxID=139825 RepID=A0A401GZC3_9APHY|nr:hypothetical protein SCP_1101850 [Sparassis crispa]GBE87508.1 hypothetical protein SCP_1101850 [Sparassis crispa]